MTAQLAVVLLSGGLDSATCLAIARAEGFTPLALSFRYGQRHTVELERAAAIAAAAGVEHHVVDIDLAAFGGSALTDPSIEVPKHDDVEAAVAEAAGGTGGHDVPVTYVPARNTIFLSFALGLAEVRGAADVYIGVNAVDYSGYPDCRPEFVAAFEEMANLATRAGVEGRRLTIHTPLIALTKADIIRWGTDLGVDYATTSTCYDPAPDAGACGRCDACLLRARGFADAGIPDPTIYAGGAR
jgi:7-cyano-7-deazaguanine synthase